MASSSDRLPSCILQNYILADVIMIIMAGHFSLVLVVLSTQEWDEGAVFAVRLFDYDKEGRGEGGSLVTHYDNTTLSVAPWVCCSVAYVYVQ